MAGKGGFCARRAKGPSALSGVRGPAGAWGAVTGTDTMTDQRISDHMAFDGAEQDRARRRRSLTDAGNPLDLKNPEAHADDDTIFSLYDAVLNEGPVRWNPEVDGPGFWAVCGYDAVTEVLKRQDLYSADIGHGGSRIFDVQDVTEVPARSIFNLDPPDRTVIRQAIGPWFTQSAVDRLEPATRAHAVALLRQLKMKGGGDFVSDVARPYMRLLGEEVMGLSAEDCTAFSDCVTVMLGDDDPALQPSVQARLDAVSEVDEIALRLFDRSTQTKTGFIPALLDLRIGGTPLDFNDFSTNLVVLFVAFTDTTRHTLGLMLDALLADPSARARLAANPDLIPVAVKEFVRLATPLIHIRRTAVRDTTLSGQPIRKGQKVVVWLPAANRDSARWSDPHRLDLARFASRTAPASLAFGAGPGFCLGWRYAEMMIGVMLTALLEEAPGLVSRGGERRMRSVLMRGYSEFPVGFAPGS